MTENAVHRQLPLALTAPDRADLDLFVAGPNAELYTRLQQLAANERADCVYLWGGRDTGKSHLLQAVCHAANGYGRRSAYLPLADLQGYGRVIFEGLESLDLVAVDDLQVISGSDDWEHALFNLYNNMRERDGCLLFAATASPRGLGIHLQDLASRLGWGPVFHVQPLADDDRREAMIRRATARGFELPEDVADYLLRRMSRNTARLMEFLDRLDTAQLASQRRLTIPFVKTLLQRGGEAG